MDTVVRGRREEGLLPSLGFRAALAAVMGWLVWALDDWRGISIVHPDYFIVAGVSVVLLLLPGHVRRHAAARVVPLAWCAYLLWLPHADTSALKPLLNGANAMTMDMDRSEIFSTIQRAYEGTPYDAPIVLEESESRISLRPSRRQTGSNSEILDIDLRDSRFAGYRFVVD